MNKLFFVRPLLVLLALFFSASARAELTVEVTRGSDSAIPIAIVPFANNAGRALPEDVSLVISNNLTRSGEFETLSTSKMLSLPSSSSEIHYRDWKLLGQSYLLVGSTDVDPERRVYRITYELIDVYQQTRIAGAAFSATAKSLRTVAHRISDAVYEAITGVRGAFSTQIAYVTSRDLTKTKREYRLQVADADGSNAFTVFKSPEPILAPAWSNDRERLAFVSFHSGRPAIYVQKIKTGEQRKVSGFQGINSSPAWSPDDKKLLLTLSKDGNAEIYELNLVNNDLRRLTNHFGIDTEASWSPDGEKIVFTSNRGGGKPQIYQMSVDDLRPVRLTFEGRYNARARYSSDGKSVHYVHQVDGQFHIATIDLETGENRVLTSTQFDESPSLAPNGRMIIYATKLEGKGVLSVVSVDGGSKYHLPSTWGDVTEPAWSPFLN